MKNNTTLIVDAKNLMYISFKGSLQDDFLVRNNINGTYYFFYKIRKTLTEFMFHPNYKINKVICVWDGEQSGILREHVYPQYKANRHKDDSKLALLEESVFHQQIETTKEISEVLGFINVVDTKTEADDIIAVYVQNKANDENIIIYSNDLDIHQLICKSVFIYNPKKSKSQYASFKLITEESFKQNYLFPVSNIATYKAIVGDISDNIKGVEGIQLKTLLKFFPNFINTEYNVEQIFEEALLIKKKSKALTSLLNSKQKVLLNYKLVDLKHPFISDFLKNNLIFLIENSTSKYDESKLETLLVESNMDKGFKQDHNIRSIKKFVVPFKKLLT